MVCSPIISRTTPNCQSAVDGGVHLGTKLCPSFEQCITNAERQDLTKVPGAFARRIKNNVEFEYHLPSKMIAPDNNGTRRTQEKLGDLRKRF